MKETGLLFKPEMVRALLAGTKTQTRRVVKPTRDYFSEYRGTKVDGDTGFFFGKPGALDYCAVPCPYGQRGDVLYVREAWRTTSESDALPPRDLSVAHRLWYEADAPHQPGFGRYRHARFMCRWMSRITLEITDIRVERLQNISYADAIAEGWTDDPNGPDPITWYRRLFESINGAGSWNSNPWLWIVEFRRLP
jgi:hypothetical protein